MSEEPMTAAQCDALRLACTQKLDKLDKAVFGSNGAGDGLVARVATVLERLEWVKALIWLVLINLLGTIFVIIQSALKVTK